MPETLITIGERAFYNCSSLNSIDIPNSVNSIGYYAFYDCKSLKTVLLSNSSSFKTIQNWCFSGCTSLENIGVHGETGPYNNKVPSNIITIGQQSFMGCSSL